MPRARVAWERRPSRACSSPAAFRARVAWLALGLLLLQDPAGGVAPAAAARGGAEPYPIQGEAPPEPIGGPVAIPGYPLPPPDREGLALAIRINEPLLAVWRRIFGSEASSLARGIGYLAGLYAAAGDVSRSESLYAEARGILEKKGTTGRDLGWVHNNQGLARLGRNSYAAAVSSFRAAVAALRPEQQQLLEPRAVTLQNLALASHLLGDFEVSEPAYLEALDLLRRSGQERGQAYQKTRQNLAGLYSSLGDYATAREILEGLAAESGMRRALRFAVLNNLGTVLLGLKLYRAAEDRFEEARALAAEGSRDQALVLMNLAATHFKAGELGKAQEEGERALRLARTLYGPASAHAAAALATLGTTALVRGDLESAEQHLTRAKAALSAPGAVGEGRPELLAAVNQTLAILAQKQGRRERAIELSREALDLASANLDRILAFGSEAQRLAYQGTASFYDDAANLGEPGLLAEAVLRTKGAVLDSLIAERAVARRSTDPAERERLARIHELKLAVMEEVARGEDRGARFRELERALRQEESALARSLALPLRRERPRAGLAEVRAALGQGQVLVEIVRFQLYEDGGRLTPHYGAVVIPGERPPAWVRLGPAEDLEPRVERLMSGIAEGRRGAALVNPGRELRGLHDLLWKPLAGAFPGGTREVLLAPDGKLHFVPWAALLDEGDTFVAERWAVSQVSSGRDLLRAAPGPAKRTLLALAHGGEDLPASRREVESLARRAADQGWRTTVLVGEEATEAELFERRGPRILHLATHGGVLGGELAQAVEERLSRRPMYRGYLMLGGAEKSFAAWRAGSLPPFARDGILTAEEAAGLDLGNTWLTVLSACSTGTGDARSGEGVLGLRRGFALAGTEHLLFTLWPVDDEAMAEFMERYYERLFATGDPARAFHETQREELRRLKPQGLPGALFQAGGMVLTR